MWHIAVVEKSGKCDGIATNNQSVQKIILAVVITYLMQSIMVAPNTHTSYDLSFARFSLASLFAHKSGFWKRVSRREKKVQNSHIFVWSAYTDRPRCATVLHGEIHVKID